MGRDPQFLCDFNLSVPKNQELRLSQVSGSLLPAVCHVAFTEVRGRAPCLCTGGSFCSVPNRVWDRQSHNLVVHVLMGVLQEVLQLCKQFKQG